MDFALQSYMSNQQPQQNTSNQNQSGEGQAAPGTKQLQIKVHDDILKGAYANAMQVSHTQEEFILDFLNLYPHQGVGIVNARVIISPGHLKRIIAALQDNLKKYEDRFGKVSEASEPTEMGFKG